TLDASPYGVPFAHAIAPASSVNGWTVARDATTASAGRIGNDVRKAPTCYHDAAQIPGRPGAVTLRRPIFWRKGCSVTNVVISSAARTAIGSHGKSLAGVPASELGATAAKAALERARLEPDQVDHVVFGNVIHTEAADMYMARVVGMKAGVPKEVPAYTVNRLCGTGVQAIVSACQSIQTGEASVALAGGAESMSRGPYWMPS